MTEEESDKREDKLTKIFHKPRKKIIQKIKISFVMLEHGWINLFIELSNLTIKFWLSSIFDPIPNIMKFYGEIYTYSKYSVLQIDEEGIYKIIEIFKQDDDDCDLFVLKITSRGLPEKDGYDEYEVIKTISLREFLTQLKTALIDLAQKNIGKVWYTYNITEFILEKLQEIESGIRPTTGST